jgi:hypothetical protein
LHADNPPHDIRVGSISWLLLVLDQGDELGIMRHWQWCKPHRSRGGRNDTKAVAVGGGIDAALGAILNFTMP